MTGLPRAVVWDLDGTLIDSAADIGTALNVLLAENGLEAHSLARVKTMIGGGIARLVERAWAAHGATLGAGGIERHSTRFLELYAERATGETRLYPGAEDVLNHLRRCKVCQAICTNKPAAISESILQHLGIAGHFGAVVGGDSTAHKKPHPLPLLTVLEALGVAKTDAVLVGDSAIDLATGHAVGLPVVLVRQGYSRDPVDGLGAEAVIDGVSDLLAALDGLPRTP